MLYSDFYQETTLAHQGLLRPMGQHYSGTATPALTLWGFPVGGGGIATKPEGMLKSRFDIRASRSGNATLTRPTFSHNVANAMRPAALARRQFTIDERQIFVSAAGPVGTCSGRRLGCQFSVSIFAALGQTRQIRPVNNSA